MVDVAFGEQGGEGVEIVGAERIREAPAIIASAAPALLPRIAAAPASAPPATNVLRRMPGLHRPRRRPARPFAPGVSPILS